MCGVWGLCASLSFGCVAPNVTTGLTEVGCVTTAEDRYVLTSHESGDRTATELYELIGTPDDLRAHVGREVLVTGEAEPARIAEVRETGAATPVGTAGSDAGAQVRTESQVRLETRKLRVVSVTPTGDQCSGGVSR
jgi:hypothetical protein